MLLRGRIAIGELAPRLGEWGEKGPGRPGGRCRGRPWRRYVFQTLEYLRRVQPGSLCRPHLPRLRLPGLLWLGGPPGGCQLQRLRRPRLSLRRSLLGLLQQSQIQN